MSPLEKAIDIALRAHAGQREKNGDPYILHPPRVMQGCETEEERIAGVLHFTGWSDYTEKIEANLYEQVREALLQQDSEGLYNMNQNWAPFYCPKCGENFHESRWSTAYIDDDYTVLQGRCPKGHKRILEN
jgi:hypothetical protein